MEDKEKPTVPRRRVGRPLTGPEPFNEKVEVKMTRSLKTALEQQSQGMGGRAAIPLPCNRYLATLRWT